MKIRYLIIIILFVKIQIAKSENFEISPLNINFVGIEAKGDTVITYGDFGSMLISYDYGNTWVQTGIFKNHLIVKIFWYDEYAIAINEKGEIAKSSDKFISWEKIKDINEHIYAIISSEKGYLVRTPAKIILYDNDFNFVNEDVLNSPVLRDNYKFQYRRSLAYFKGAYYISIDSAAILRYDENLTFIDKLSLPELFGVSSNPSYEIDIINDTFIIRTGSSIIETRDFYDFSTLYNIKYFGFYRFVNDSLFYITYFHPQMSDYYERGLNLYKVVGTDSTEKLTGKPNFSELMTRFVPKDFIINKEKLIVVGDDKMIITMNISDTISTIKSYFFSNTIPDRTNDSTLLFYTEGAYGQYFSPIYKTTDFGITFQPVYKSAYNSKNKFNRTNYKYYDKISRQLSLFVRDRDNDLIKGVIVLDDNAKEVKVIEDVNFVPGFFSREVSNIQVNDDYFIYASNSFYLKAYTNLIFINKNHEYENYYHDTDFFIRYLHCKDTTNYLLNVFNFLNSSFEIKYTTNKGNSWTINKKYDTSYQLLQQREFTNNGKNFAFFVYLHKLDSTIIIDVLDTETHGVETILYKNIKPNFNQHSFALDYDGENFFIALDDTLFQTTDIFNKSNWQFYIFPNNGRVYQNLKKINNKFVAVYEDNQRNMGMYWLKPLVEPTGVLEQYAGKRNYLYAYPAYPMPANNEVRSLIYWDKDIDIDGGAIAVYDINGLKVAGKEKIRIDRLTEYNGYLIWDCSENNAGVYLINIRHGTENLSIKAIVTK